MSLLDLRLSSAKQKGRHGSMGLCPFSVFFFLTLSLKYSLCYLNRTSAD